MKDRLTVVDPFAAVIGGEINALADPLWTPWPVPFGWTFGGFAHAAPARRGGLGDGGELERHRPVR